MIGPLVFPAVCNLIDSCHSSMIDRHHRHTLSSSHQNNMTGPFVFSTGCIVIDSCHGHVIDRPHRRMLSSIHQNNMIGPLVFPAGCIVIDSCHSHMIGRYRHILSSSHWCNMIGPLLFHRLCIVIDICHYRSESMHIHLDQKTTPPVDQFLHTQFYTFPTCNSHSHLERNCILMILAVCGWGCCRAYSCIRDLTFIIGGRGPGQNEKKI